MADLIRNKPMKESVAKRYTYQILEGLRYLHQHDIIHMDIKCKEIGVGQSKTKYLQHFEIFRI